MVFDVNGNSNALDKSIQGAYLHLRHYNYNNRPVYYKSSRDAESRDMYLYFGSINNIPGDDSKGWIIHPSFGLLNEPPELYYLTQNETTCPEDIGQHWNTKEQTDVVAIKVKCLNK